MTLNFCPSCGCDLRHAVVPDNRTGQSQTNANEPLVFDSGGAGKQHAHQQAKPKEPLTLNFDGGCFPNPGGPPNWAYVLTNHNGTEIDACRGVASAKYPRTNNTAEFSGLLMGLRAVKKGQTARIEVKGDSKLVIDAVSKKWTMKKSPHLAELRCLIQEEIERLGVRVDLKWIPRRLNYRADSLT